MKKRFVVPIVLVLLVAIAVPVVARAASDEAAIRRATSRYHRVEMAEADGFVQLFDCIADPAQPSKGAMGVHYIKPDRFDADLDLEEPEVLVYEPLPNGEMKLAAVEYIIPAAAWSDGAPAPQFLGQELKYKTTMGKYGEDDGIDPYYEVHVWVWEHNPSGMFADWNPNVTCPSPAVQ
jgi:hypothetical protein